MEEPGAHTAPGTQRVFPFWMASSYPSLRESLLHWLSYLLRRLGREATLSIWQAVRQDYDDRLLLEILGSGWLPAESNPAPDLDRAMAEQVRRFFPATVDGVSPKAAGQLIDGMPPVSHILHVLPSLNTWKPMTAYEAVHLRSDVPALLAERAIERYGKQGELIVYDLLQEERVMRGNGRTGSVARFMAEFESKSKDPDIFSAGLVMEALRASGTEVTFRVMECEWARYFHERHPRVGYLMACSTDEAAYRAFNPSLRLQRTSTLMEGGPMCDFRIYGLQRVSGHRPQEPATS
jgi:hypothetical protein